MPRPVPTITPTDATLGATITDVDLAAMDETTWRRVENAFHEHAVLIFPGQALSEEAQIGYEIEPGSGYGFHAKGAPLRPLVKTHPVTGRKSLFIGRHAYRIPGMDDEEAQGLLDDLVTFACRAPRTLTHRWRAGDVVIWDNRCVLHRARPYDFSRPRTLRHVRVAGDPASELAPTGRDERAGAFEPSASNR